MYYQPIVQLSTGITKGYESLLRGNLSTEEIFKRYQLQNRLIELDFWCIQNAINLVGKLKYDQKLFINCHPRTLNEIKAELINQAMFNNSPINPNQVVLEITEHEEIDLQSYHYHIEKLRKLGILIAIDDFGNKISDLQYLKQMNPDIVKIDKAIADNLKMLEVQNFIEELIFLQQDQKFKIIAEGIETEEQNQIFQYLGIEYGQGWLFGKPQPNI